MLSVIWARSWITSLPEMQAAICTELPILASHDREHKDCKKLPDAGHHAMLPGWATLTQHRQLRYWAAIMVPMMPAGQDAKEAGSERLRQTQTHCCWPSTFRALGTHSCHTWCSAGASRPGWPSAWMPRTGQSRW